MIEYAITLETLAEGAAKEDFEAALQDVVRNINDPNTVPDAARSITLNVKFRPSADRKKVDMEVDLKTKLAGAPARRSAAWLNRRGGAVELVGVDPEQASIYEVGSDTEEKKHVQ